MMLTHVLLLLPLSADGLLVLPPLLLLSRLRQSRSLDLELFPQLVLGELGLEVSDPLELVRGRPGGLADLSVVLGWVGLLELLSVLGNQALLVGLDRVKGRGLARVGGVVVVVGELMASGGDGRWVGRRPKVALLRGVLGLVERGGGLLVGVVVVRVPVRSGGGGGRVGDEHERHG
jgi:hypothetical protein